MERQVEEQVVGPLHQGRALSTLVHVYGSSEGTAPFSRQYWANLISGSNGSPRSKGVRGDFGCSHQLQSCICFLSTMS